MGVHNCRGLLECHLKGVLPSEGTGESMGVYGAGKTANRFSQYHFSSFHGAEIPQFKSTRWYKNARRPLLVVCGPVLQCDANDTVKMRPRTGICNTSSWNADTCNGPCAQFLLVGLPHSTSNSRSVLQKA